MLLHARQQQSRRARTFADLDELFFGVPKFLDRPLDRVPVHAECSETQGPCVTRRANARSLRQPPFERAQQSRRILRPFPAEAIVCLEHAFDKGLHAAEIAIRCPRIRSRESRDGKRVVCLLDAQLGGELARCARRERRAPVRRRCSAECQFDSAQERDALARIRSKRGDGHRLFQGFAEIRGGEHRLVGRNGARHQAHMMRLASRNPQLGNHVVEHARQLRDVAGPVTEVVRRPARKVVTCFLRHREPPRRIFGRRYQVERFHDARAEQREVGFAPRLAIASGAHRGRVPFRPLPVDRRLRNTDKLQGRRVAQLPDRDRQHDAVPDAREFAVADQRSAALKEDAIEDGARQLLANSGPGGHVDAGRRGLRRARRGPQQDGRDTRAVAEYTASESPESVPVEKMWKNRGTPVHAPTT